LRIHIAAVNESAKEIDTMNKALSDQSKVLKLADDNSLAYDAALS
jgi:hypothetical protein